MLFNTLGLLGPAARNLPLPLKDLTSTKHDSSASVRASRLSPHRPESFGLAALSSISSMRTL
jgi:hypothetical protein